VGLRETVYEYGSTAEERAAPYPCDALLEDHDAELFRAVDVNAPTETVFAWLCQMRVAPYSYDWLDNWGRQSPRRRDPALEELEVGQTFMSIFRLESFDRPRQITLWHDGLFGKVAGTYAVNPGRLVVKLLWRYPGGPARHVAGALLPAGDVVMMRKQLRTLAGLAESETNVQAKISATAGGRRG
jgi:hypothetical protein